MCLEAADILMDFIPLINKAMLKAVRCFLDGKYQLPLTTYRA